MPHYIDIVSSLACLRPFLRLNSIFKLILTIVCRGQQAVLAFIRRFLLTPLHCVSSPDKVVPGTSVRGTCSFDSGTASALSAPMPTVAEHVQSLMPPSPTLACSTAVGNRENPQTVIQEDVLSDELVVNPFSPEDLGNRRNMTQGQIKRTVAEPIPPVKVEFTVPEVEGGWTRHIHPEGSIYYQNESTAIQLMPSGQNNQQVSLAVLTCCDLSGNEVLHKITACSDYLYKELWKCTDLPPFDHIELVLDIVQESQGVLNFFYYFVDHRRKVVFWPCEYSPAPIYCNVKGVQAEDHIRLAIEAQYWYSWSYVWWYDPLLMDIKPLCDTLLHSLAESILSESALASYTTTELQQMLELTSNIVASREKINSSTIQGPSLYVIARMTYIFTRMKFINFYGQEGARLNADQSLYVKDRSNDTRYTSLWFRVVNTILLSAPHDQFEHLKTLWVDETINQLRWKTFVTAQSNDLAAFTIYSTVMLTVNVGFLAVPGVISQNQFQTATPMMIPIYISTMCSVGSLVSALLLSTRGRRQSNQTALEVAEYMLESASSKTRMEWLAVIYSLPFSFLLWGMVSFAVAFCVTVFSLSGVGMHASMALCVILIAGLALSPVLWLRQRWHAALDRRSLKRLLPWSHMYP